MTIAMLWSNAIAKASAWSLNYIWLVLLVAVACANTPFFLNQHFPQHDALLFLQSFKYYYSNVRYFREIPLWVPYTGYGLPIDYYTISTLGPFQYLAIAAGIAFKVDNVQRLFLFSLVLDIYFLALSMYLLAREAGAVSIGAFAAAIAMTGTTFPDIQLDFNYKVIISLPLCMYLILRLVRTLDVRLAFACIATLLLFTYGAATYLLVIQVYLLGIWLGAILLFRRPQPSVRVAMRKLRTKIFHPRSLLYLAVGVNATVGLWHALHIIFSELQSLAGLRDLHTSAVPLKVFLTYGGNTNADKLVEAMTGLPVARDFKFYPGLVTLGLVVYGIAVCWRNAIVRSSALTTAVVLLFVTPDATPVARYAYYLPGMNMVRHVGDFAVIAKPTLFVIGAIALSEVALHFDKHRCGTLLLCLGGTLVGSTLAAAVVVDNLWERLVRAPAEAQLSLAGASIACGYVVYSSLSSRFHGRRARLFTSGFVALVTVAVVFAPIGRYLPVSQFYAPFVGTFPGIWLSSASVVFLACVSLARHEPKPARAAMLLLTFGIIEICGYRAMILKASPSFAVYRPQGPKYMEPLQWRSTRRYDSEEPIVNDVFAQFPIDSALYGFRSAFLNIDSCNPKRQDLLVKGVLDLRLARETGLRLDAFTRREVDLSQYSQNFLIPGDESFAHAMGCHAPKLQLVPDPLYAGSPDQAAALVHKSVPASQEPPLTRVRASVRLPPIDQYPVIEAPLQAPAARAPAQDAEATVVEFSPNRLVLDLLNPYGSDAWLVYLDAFTPRWQAFIDKKSTPIRRVNLAFKGVSVPPGRHRAIFVIKDSVDTIVSAAVAVILGLSGLWLLVVLIRLLKRDARAGILTKVQ